MAKKIVRKNKVFAVVQEERTNVFGVKFNGNDVQRGVFVPKNGAERLAIKNYNLNGSWSDKLFAIIDEQLVNSNEPTLIYCNKSIGDAAFLLDIAITAVVKGDFTEEDKHYELMTAVAENAVNNGLSREVIENAFASEDRRTAFCQILALAVDGVWNLPFDINGLFKIANYIADGHTFDNIYYVLDEVTTTDNQEYWVFINNLKRTMLKDVEVPNKDENVTEFIMPTEIVEE